MPIRFHVSLCQQHSARRCESLARRGVDARIRAIDSAKSMNFPALPVSRTILELKRALFSASLYQMDDASTDLPRSARCWFQLAVRILVMVARRSVFRSSLPHCRFTATNMTTPDRAAVGDSEIPRFAYKAAGMFLIAPVACFTSAHSSVDARVVVATFHATDPSPWSVQVALTFFLPPGFHRYDGVTCDGFQAWTSLATLPTKRVPGVAHHQPIMGTGWRLNSPQRTTR